jgi:hypothetical protein
MEEKTCSKCRKTKSIKEFNKKTNSITQTYCRECQQSFSREHYSKNREYYALRNTQRKLELRAFIDELKSKPCSDCGNQYDPCAMDFDHINNDKEFDIALMITRKCSKQAILREVAKCELVCAVCHRIRTKKRNLERS